MSDFNELVATLRTFAERLVAEGEGATLRFGIAGAARERARATAAQELLALLPEDPRS